MKLLALLLLAAFTLPAQFDIEQADRYNWYSSHWNGSISGGTVFSLAIPSDTSTDKRVYPSYLSVICTVATTLSIRKDASTNPTSTVGTPTPMNTSVSAVFRHYTSSNVGTGTLVTTWPVPANVPRNLPFPGSMLPTGRTNTRNFSAHISAASGTCYATWLTAQSK